MNQGLYQIGISKSTIAFLAASQLSPWISLALMIGWPDGVARRAVCHFSLISPTITAEIREIDLPIGRSRK